MGLADRCVYWVYKLGWNGAGRGQTVYVVIRQAVILGIYMASGGCVCNEVLGIDAAIVIHYRKR